MRRALLTAGLLLSLGCADSFEPASLVQNLRPVAALVEVEGDPSRPNPDPGDEIRVTQHVIDRGPKPKIEWRFVACVPAFTVINPPLCGSLIEPCENCVNDAGPLAVDPIVRFQVPGESELDGETLVVLQGAICEGKIASEERLFELLFGAVNEINPCDDPDDKGRLVAVNIPLEQYEPVNEQPVIASVEIGGRDDRWLDLPDWAPRTGCLNEIQSSTQCIPSTVGVAGIQLSVTPESLQEFENEDGDSFQEEIQVSWLADGGSFERSFSFIDETSPTDDTNPFESVSWALPSQPAIDGSYVRFNFVIRDGRGGTAWEERGLCVVPPDVYTAACR